MILRKPYAFLIKNFKVIHILLCIPMIYLAYESRNILSFLNDYIATGTFTRTSFSLSSTYINIFMFVAALLIAGLTIIIYILMRMKKKPKLLYLILILSYLGLIVYYFIMYNILGTIEISTINQRSIRVIRDLSTVICLVQYAFIIVIAIRAVGFNIKKFNFGEDLAELEIDVNDNEEFELTVGIDPDKIKHGIRKSKREIKYFIIENKFVLSLISILFLMTVSIIIFLNVSVFNKIYSQNDSFKAGYFVGKINHTYLTDLNQKGISIAPTGKSFLAVSVTFNNNNTWGLKLNLDDINIVSGDDIFSPVINRYQTFIDLGEGYISQTIKANSAATFILIFEINDNTNLNDLIFRYRDTLKIVPGKLEAKYKTVKLNSEFTNDIKKINEVSLGEELSFSSSALENSKLKIKGVEINDPFTYEASSCYNDICTTFQSILTIQYTSTLKTLMKLSFDYAKDSNIKLSSYNTLALVINSFGSLRYVYNGKTYTTNIINRTPINYNGSDLYYEVPSVLKDATEIQLLFTIRNKQFVYNFK